MKVPDKSRYDIFFVHITDYSIIMQYASDIDQIGLNKNF